MIVEVRGAELAAAVNLLSKDVKVEGTLFLPQKVGRVRAVIVVINLKVVTRIPALFLAGDKDETAGVEDTQDLWKNGRSAGAPWTFAVEPGATHDSLESLKKANDLMIPWITAVVREHVPPDNGTLRVVTETSAWMGNNRTADVALYSSFSASKFEASWLPDESSARGWRIVLGVSK